MNNLKSKAGFTLVELIVVIVILAILAGVAVPAYNGYITKANDAKTLTSLDAVKTAVFAANATSSTTISSIEVESSGVTINGSTSVDVSAFFDMSTLTLAGTYENGAQWNASNNTWIAH